MIVKSTNYIQNHRAGFGWIGTVFKLNYGCWMFCYLGVSVVLSILRAFTCFVFLIKLGGIKSVPRMIQVSALCLILPHNSQLVFCIMQIASITGWVVFLSLLV